MTLTNSQYEQVMSIYYDRQLRTKHIGEQRYQEVISAIPLFKELDQKIRDISLAHARDRLEGRKNSDSLTEQINAVTREKESLLTSHGFPADYLRPVYTCEDCRDTGYIDGVKCHCFEKEIVNYLYTQSNLRNVLDRENFTHFNLDYYPDDYIEETTDRTPRDNMRAILETVNGFIKNFDEHRENLLLYGNTGVGKTFLTNCIAKELLDTSHTVLYLTSLKLFDILETNKFDRDLSQEMKDASISYIMESDLLIIDDLGTELINSFTSSQLYQCIETRLNNNSSTIISTNLSFDALREQYSERIFSRLTSNYTLLKLTGEDIRIQKAIEKH